MRYALVPLLAILALIGAGLPAYAQDTSTSQPAATIITYTVPITLQFSQNATVAAGNSTNLSFTMPYKLGSDAKIYFSYRLTDANGTLLNDTSNITIKLSFDGEEVNTILLSSGSPAEAIVPLSAVPENNITVEILNEGDSDAIAEVRVTVLDGAKFTVSVSPQSVQVSKGGDADVKVTITQESGPGGTLFLQAFIQGYPKGLSTKITPDQVKTQTGGKYTFIWTFHAGSSVNPGQYTGKLEGVFEPGHIPGILSGQVHYTFAEVIIPVVASEAGVAGVAGFSLGALAGAKLGMWAVAIGIVFLIVIIALIVKAAS